MTEEFKHFNFQKEGYDDHAYSPYRNYPLRLKCSTCENQDTCERIETFNNDGCSYHTKGTLQLYKKKPLEIMPQKIKADVKYLTRVNYTGISRVEL